MPKKSSEFPNNQAPQNPQQLFTLTTVIASVVSGVIGFLAASILFLFQTPTNPDQPLIAGPDDTGGISCKSLAGDDLQNCCQAWADRYEPVLPACQGQWLLQNGQCSWICRSE